jgi:putative endonuclease
MNPSRLLRRLSSLLHKLGVTPWTGATNWKTPVSIGAYWEKVAAKALKKEHYTIVARNWRNPGAHGEIDIVAKVGAVLVFVEVRSRGAEALVGGYDSITRDKKEVLRRTCLAYLSGLKKRPQTYRFDVVEISYRDAKDYEIRHYTNIPLFG